MAQHSPGPPGLIRPSDVAATAWANGRGVSRLLCVRQGWRISVAEIAGPEPFSLFPGLDRVLIPLNREGVTLGIDGKATHVAMHELCSFAGEAMVAGLSAHPARVLNIMTARVAARATLETLSGNFPDLWGNISERMSQDLGGETVLVVLGGDVWAGGERVPSGSLVFPHSVSALSGRECALLVARWGGGIL